MRRDEGFWLMLLVASAPWNWCSAQGSNQWQANGGGDQYLITAPPLFTAAPNSVTIGTAPNGASALVVEGGQMFTPTGEVFRTDAPNGTNTSWRLFRGGTNYGRVFNLSTDAHFRLDASAGDLRFHTNGLDRGRFNQTLTGQLINGFPGLDLSGFLGVGNFTGAYSNASARVHVDNASTLTLGYRDVIKEGFLATRGEALYYGGILDGSNSGVLWSYLTGSSGTPGSFKFIYTGDNQVLGTVASGAPGLELGRFEPDANLNEGYFGIGDWTSATVTPDERLDILDRTIRLRNFMVPTPAGLLSYERTTLVNVLVADPLDGRVYWRTLPNTIWGGGTTACDWEVTGADHVVTAYLPGPLPGCPDQSNNVGIGTNSPAAKLDMVRIVNSGGPTSTGFNLRMGTTSTNNVGGNVDVQTTAGGQNTGWRASVRSAGQNWGLDGNAAVNSLANTGLWGSVRVVGVRGFADGNGVMPKPNVRGVWGVAIGALNPTGGPPTMGYAGWFDGDVNIQGGNLFLNQVFAISDASVKTGVQDIESAGDIIAQLQPKSYFFDTLAHVELGLPSNLQRGLLAPDVEQVLPELVTEVQHEARYDTLGNEVAAAYTLKAVNYVGFIPLLLANAKEQQAVIAQQNARIDQLQAQVAQCCNGGAVDSHSMQQGVGSGSAIPLETDLRIVPNPVASNTQLRYSLAAAGRIRLEVTDNSGRVVEVLENTTRTAGNFTYEWNTQQLASGTYYCTLYLNDERLVQKAVKLSER